jgi:uncharacterized membrane protein YcaP (DUF421 family)
MDIWLQIWGEGKELNALQMSCRGIAVFFIALLLIRISGRRSFGVRTPLDNIIVILLGATLSRGITGASPFLPTVAASLAVVVLHRLVGYLTAKKAVFSKLIEGDKIVLFRNNRFIKENMDRVLVSKEDVLQGVRESASTDKTEKIEIIYMERNGEISVIKKDE